ncbi:suppressor APC domain-containing protein 2 [Protopterus annectens]|uniref:suppressor APC domain-containing protein 2 n=1 Tax=Protopterus annectens TaxID=7888 RepID=UPI001CFBBC24|nr:suppressor APC domain-containing protein 2 [Protopterus annectens]
MHRVESRDSSTEGLPRAFLQSLRTLFDILDDGHRGSVHISEIESRWQRGTEIGEELPQGVLDGLRKVVPGNGYLTFEKFVAGLRHSLQLESVSGRQRSRASSLSALPFRSRKENAWVKPRTSAPQVLDEDRVKRQQCDLQHCPGHGTSACELNGKEKKPSPLGVRFMNGDHEETRVRVDRQRGYHEHNTGRQLELCRAKQLKSLADRRLLDALIQEPAQGSRPRDGEGKSMGRSQSESNYMALADVHPQCRSGRVEVRRHTITSGVDYCMLKRMKELEQEKDFLVQGLELVEWSRNWYLQQIQNVQDQQKYMGKNPAKKDSCPESNPIRLAGVLPKLQEVNRCLGDLFACTGKPLKSSPVASNGGPSTAPTSAPSESHQQAINMLKEQNRLLTKEVTDKSERITQLEQEKSALIKQLFEARARNAHDSSQLDSTFI